MLLAHGVEAVAQVVGVVVEEAAFLDEVDEHHAVEHEGGVPFAVGRFLYTFNKAQEGLMRFLEAVVEAFGDLFDIEGGAHAAGNVDERQVFFLVEGEEDGFQFLDERFAALPGVVDVGARAVGAARFAFDPEPVLGATVVGAEDDDVLARLFGDGSLDLLAGGAVGEFVADRARYW